jgi:hypothetical protein
MHTIRLRVNDGVYDKLMWLLSKFSKEEVEVFLETENYTINSEYLSSEYKDIVDGKANFMSFEEAEQRLEKTINKHENSI